MKIPRDKRIKALRRLIPLAALAGCSIGTLPPPAARGIPLKDRYAFVAQNGQGIRSEVRDAFLNGCLVKGMGREFVFRLYGVPDRNSEGGEGWEYVDRNGNLITGVLFREEKVDSVYGDPYGGGPPSTVCR